MCYDSNIPVDHQSRLGEQYSSAPVCCTECGEEITCAEDFEHEIHDDCIYKLIESTINQY